MGKTVKVIYFGDAAEIAEKAGEDFNADDTVALLKQILKKYPPMKNISFRIAVNRVMLKKDSGLNENDIVAILPPFQGG